MRLQRLALVLSLSVCFVLSSRAARADQPPLAEPSSTVTPTAAGERWYGWQTVMTDLSGALMFTVGATTPLIYPGGFTLALGSPLIHLAHGNTTAAAGSLALRTLGAFGMFGVVTMLTNGGPPGGRFDYVSDGALAMAGVYVIATVVDAAVLAFESAPAEPCATARPAAKPKVWPEAAMLRGGAAVGVAGSL